jgi:hypothetical protein
MSKKRIPRELPASPTTKEVAEYAGLSASTLQGEVTKWTVTGGEVGLRRRAGRGFHRADVLDWLRRRKAERMVKEVFEAIRRLGNKRKVHIPSVHFRFTCLRLDIDCKNSPRIYAHAHKPGRGGGNVVCVHPTIVDLVPHKVAGIVLHEIGHVMSGEWEEQSSEPRADDWVRNALGIEVLYDSGDTIEYLDKVGMTTLGWCVRKGVFYAGAHGT